MQHNSITVGKCAAYIADSAVQSHASNFAIFWRIPLWSAAACYLRSVFGVIVTVILLLLQQKPKVAKEPTPGTSGFAHGPFTARMQDMGSWPAWRVLGFGFVFKVRGRVATGHPGGA